ncbi:MAG: sugar phosphate isomerase/epimerase [Pirellulaceae bacterium]|nr:sugar phosphate isomerase/epimerase [Pirellulaceae bacterium]
MLSATGLLGANQPTAAGGHRWRFAMCNETFGDWDQPRIFRTLAETGYTGVEIAPFTLNPDVRKISQHQRDSLRKAAEDAGVQLCALHWLLSKTEGFHLTHPDRVVRTATADYLGELARFCRDLGGSVMVFGSPQQRNLLPGVERQQAMNHAAEVLQRVVPVLAECNVVLALEPLSPRTTTFLATAAEAVELAERVDSPQCKLLLDCLAMTSESIPPSDLIRRYAKWLVHFHANDPNRRGPGMGTLDFGPIFQALRDVDYRGWVSVEVFDVSPGAETIARESLKYMKEMVAALPR